MPWLLAATVILALGPGCKKATEEAIESAIESQAARHGSDADVEIGNESFSMQVQGKDGQQTMQIGEDADLPAGFPEDVPLYPNWTILIAHSQEQNSVFMIQAKSEDPLPQVAEFFTEHVPQNGWEETSGTSQGEKMKIVQYAKEDRTLSIVLNTAEKGTGVNVTVAKK
jgi:hypothetical protein